MKIPDTRWAVVAAALVAACVLVPSVVSLAQEPEDLLPFLAQGVAPSDSAFPAPRPRQPAGQTLPLNPTRHIAFETDEGTLDVR